MNQSTRNVILFLAVCTVFVSTADCDTCTYSSTCYKQQRYTTTCGFLGWKRCTRYRSVAYSCTLTSSCSYILSSCGSCSQSCGGGIMTCTYYCRGSLCSLPNKDTSQSCNTHRCPIDGNWIAWSNWAYGTCSVTCGGGIQGRNRNRSCTNPMPQFDGKPCIGNATESEVVSCNTDKCPIDGSWSVWTDWKYSNCDVTCDGGTQIRNRIRLCNYPSAQYGGKECIGNSKESETVSCNRNKCPIDGNWIAWSNWAYGTCSVTCGGGIQGRNRNRSCTNPMPQFDGKPCIGNATESEVVSCNTDKCPIDGSWSVWTDWKYSNCDVTCDGGTQIRNRIRLCNYPSPQYGGNECIGNSKESETVSCNRNKCPIDGKWIAWSNWSYGTCSVTCGGGIQGRNRSRSCTNPMPQFDGKPCIGNATESEAVSCNTDKCPKDGGWSDWGDWQWSNCSRPCNGGKRIRYKTRSCTNPAPSNGGQHCIGQTYKYVEMECNIHNCPKKSRETLNLKRVMDDIFSDELPCTNGTVRVNTKNCENFRVCINGTWQELACNKGTLYDSDIEACNWPKNVPGCTNTSNITTRATETRSGDGSGCKSVDCVCQDSIDGIIGHPTDCTKFITCIGSKPYVESCDDGTYWEQSMLSCQSGTC